MTYGHLQADCLYTGISCGPNAIGIEYGKPLPFFTFILVADRSEAGRRPVPDLLSRAIGQIPARCRSATSLGPVCDHLRTRLQPGQRNEVWPLRTTLSLNARRL